jgi:O-antigen/teichoic acid export membrane protein
VAVLAGFGVEIIASAPPISRADRPRRTLLPLAARLAMFVGGRSLSLGVLIVLGVVTSRAAYRAIEGIVQQVFDALAGAAYAFPDARAFYSYQARNALLLALMLTLAGAALLASRSGRRVGGIPVWQGLAALAVIVDLGIAGWGFSPAADPALLEVTPPSIAWLKARYDPLEPWRLAVYEEPGSDTLNANMAWLHGLEDIAGYDSLIPGQYADYMRAIMPQDDLPYNRIAPVYAQHAAALDSPLLDLLGVRYVVSEAEIDSPRYTLAYQDDAVRIYENGEALPRAFTLPVTSTVISAADNPAEGFRLLAQQFDFRRYVVVNIHQSPFTAPPADPPIASDPGPAAITVSTAQEMWIDVEVGAESWLIVTASHFPGWRAWVRPLGAGEADEQEIAVYPVNGNFRGMVLPPGRWTVRTKFSPDTFKAGAFASFLTGLALLFALGVWAWRLIYREEPGSAGIRRVAKNTLTPILLNLFNKGILFVLTFAQLRILGPSGAGDYRYAVVIWGWFEIFSNFGLNTFLIREVARHKDEASRYLAATTLLRLVLAALGIPVLAGFLAARQALVADPLDTATLWATGLLYSGLFFSTISTGLTALFYAHEKAEHPAAVQTVSAFLTTTLGIGALLLGWGIVGLAAVSVVVNAITLGILGVLAVRLFFPHRPALSASLRQGFDRALQRTALGESFPLMLNHLLATLFFRIAVVLLEAIQGSAVVGWYGVVYTWVDAIGIIPAFFTLSLFPVMSRQATDDRPALRQTYLLAIKLMTLLSVPTAIFTTLLAPFLVNVLGGSQYLPHGAIALQVFIWAMTFGWINSVTQYVIIALNRQRTLTVAFLVVSAFNIAANVLLIPRYSYLASAVIAILSEFVLWGLFYVVILSELGRVSWAAALGRVALAGIAAGAATLALAQVSTWLALVVGAAIYAAAALAVRPFNADERRLLAPALPGPLRRWMAGPAEG